MSISPVGSSANTPVVHRSSLSFPRVFVPEGSSPVDGLSWTTREVSLRDGGELIGSIEVEVPSSWSSTATDVLAQKYLRKAGVPRFVKVVPEEGIPEWLWRAVADEEKLAALPGDQRFGAEKSLRQVAHRLAGCWAYWGVKDGLLDAVQARVLYDEVVYMILRQMGAPNSPQWFNTGLYWAYGIDKDPEGHFYVDPVTEEVVPSTSAYERPQPQACFIQSVADDLVNPGGIMDLWVKEARLFKHGSGTGSNFSGLRGRGEPLSGGGRSSGLMSWLKIGDRAAAGIKSGGTTRRAAKMVVVDVDHPDVPEFIDWKVSEQHKVVALVVGSTVIRQHLRSVIEACGVGELSELERFDVTRNPALRRALHEARSAGVPEAYLAHILDAVRHGEQNIRMRALDLDWQGEAYETVSGQQANNTVRVGNAFMEAVERDEPWELTWRTTDGVAATLPARELWDRIGHAAWFCADPGLQFSTTINEWHTCPSDGPILASNPCSEYLFLDDTACNLASINLVAFEHPEGGVDLDRYRHAIRLWTTVLDISVTMAQLPSATIARRTYDYRTLGLGYANLGALLMRTGLPYDSDGGRAVAASLTAVLTGEAYAQSARLAAVKGPFPRFEENRESMLRVVRNHRQAVRGGGRRVYEGLSVLPVALVHSDAIRATASDELVRTAMMCWDEALELGMTHGYRNAQATVIAPTGTIGLVMDCDTTGIEPDFALVKHKSLAGGGSFNIVNASIPVALARLGYAASDVEDISRTMLGTRQLSSAVEARLRADGFTDTMLKRVSSSLETAFHVTMACSVSTLGIEACVKHLGIDPSKAVLPGYDLLSLIGWSNEDISRFNDQVCGTRTVEGTAVMAKHLPVFDCATRCGSRGRRFIRPEGHIRMLAAVQPFVSGAISKTVNLPSDASISDVRNAYMLAWKLGLKAMALYRDGSKLSQPLSADRAQSLFGALEDGSGDSQVVEAAERLVIRYLSERRKLPWKRHGYTQKARIGGHKMFLKTGEYPDGSVGEIFVTMHKEGASFGALMNAFCVAVSLGLQHGVPLERFVQQFTFSRFEPNGPVEGDEQVQMCTSIIDYVFRNLAVNYLDRQELAHVKREDIEHHADEAQPPKWQSESVVVTPVSPGRAGLSVGLDSEVEMVARVPSTATEVAKLMGYEGEACVDCGALSMVMNGSCLKCMACGATSGCS